MEGAEWAINVMTGLQYRGRVIAASSSSPDEMRWWTPPIPEKRRKLDDHKAVATKEAEISVKLRCLVLSTPWLCANPDSLDSRGSGALNTSVKWQGQALPLAR